MIIDSFPEVIEVATTSSPVEAPPIGWPCPVEEGFCVKQDGGDQNDGVIKINNMDGNTEEAQKECLQACLNHEGATGCEVIWDQGNRGCYIHTDIIHHGNGVGNHLCWLFTPENDFSTCLLTDGGKDNTPDGGCPSCCSGLEQEDHSVEWITSQDDPLSNVTAFGSEVLMEFADDELCGGVASKTQNMTAVATVTLQEDTYFDLLWNAVAEDQYETLTITVNGVVRTQFTAQADGSCAVSTCVMCVIKDQTQQILLNAGDNIIKVDTTTNDGWYHKDAFFRVRFRQASCDADCSVCELTNELIIPEFSEGAPASEPPATTDPPTIPVTQPPLITNGSKPTTVDDVRFPPIGPEECPYDILLLKHDGVTTYPENSVRVLSRDAKTVTVDLSQLFTTSTLANPTTIDYIFYQYNVNVFNNKCFEEDNVVGGESLAVITIECTRTSQVAFLEVWVADDVTKGVLDEQGDTALIPKCCYPDAVPKGTPVTNYNIEIKCVSACQGEIAK